MNRVSYFILLIIISLGSPLLHGQVTIADGSLNSPAVNNEGAGAVSIGAIFDDSSRPGKEAKVAIEMVVHDFNSEGNQNLQIYYGNSHGKPGRAALAARDLISTHGVKAILGAHTWDETLAISEAASEEAHDVPVLSFADSTPTTPSPSVLQATPSQEVQMSAIAAIIQSWGLNEVTLIYENAPTLSSHELIISQLSQVLQQSGGDLSHIFALTSFSLKSLQKELIQLKKQNHRVFVIHATLESGYLLYQNAKKLNMTGDGYAWIATNSITDLFHAVSPKKLSSLQGIVGTKTYFPENSLQFQDFRKSFRSKFRNFYADEEFDEPGIFASQAYDAMRDLLYKNNIINLFQITCSGMWLFLKPFTKEMWGVLVAITIYNGFAVWLIERNHNKEFKEGTVWNQIGILIWLAFSTLFTLRGDKLHSNLSRMAMVVWLFVALIITQSYTASLASMLTAQRLEPTIKNVETLKKMNATVGYCKGWSFLKEYMVTALGFEVANINNYNSTDAYAEALNNKTIAGIFLQVPPAKVFLAQYCNSFTKTEKTFKVGGFGFAFQKGFKMLPDINKAIMNITESGRLLELEKQYIYSEECKDVDSAPNDDGSIGLNSFSVLFGISGGISTIALAMYVLKYFLSSKPDDGNLVKSNFIQRWLHHGRQLSARVIDVEPPRNPPDVAYLSARNSSDIEMENLEDHAYAPDHHNQV